MPITPPDIDTTDLSMKTGTEAGLKAVHRQPLLRHGR
jgi:hypothetical protein